MTEADIGRLEALLDEAKFLQDKIGVCKFRIDIVEEATRFNVSCPGHPDILSFGEDIKQSLLSSMQKELDEAEKGLRELELPLLLGTT